MSEQKTVRVMVFTDTACDMTDFEWLSYPDGSVKVHRVGVEIYEPSIVTHRELHSPYFKFKELRDVPAI